MDGLCQACVGKSDEGVVLSFETCPLRDSNPYRNAYRVCEADQDKGCSSPVEAGAHHQCHVSTPQRCAARRIHAQRVVVGQQASAHGGAQHRHTSAVCAFRVRVEQGQAL